MNKRGGALFSPGETGFEGAVVKDEGAGERERRAFVPTAGYVNQAKRRGIGGETNFRGEADSGYDERREKYRTQAEETSARNMVSVMKQDMRKE